jgi:hypothetical protein
MATKIQKPPIPNTHFSDDEIFYLGASPAVRVAPSIGVLQQPSMYKKNNSIVLFAN